MWCAGARARLGDSRLTLTRWHQRLMRWEGLDAYLDVVNVGVGEGGRGMDSDLLVY
jgi:hypothetical protein